MNDDSHDDNYFFVSPESTIQTLMPLSTKSRGTHMIDEPADTIEHTEKSVPVKYGTRVKTASLKLFTLKD